MLILKFMLRQDFNAAKFSLKISLESLQIDLQVFLFHILSMVNAITTSTRVKLVQLPEPRNSSESFAAFRMV